MFSKQFLFLLFIFCTVQWGFSQKKSFQTHFTTDKINIDGKFDESVWNTVQPAKDFVMWRPDNAKSENPNQKTEVKIVYTNEAIYVAATMFDNEPSKILKEISQRDDTGTADFFGVFINGFNDGQQDFRFYVTAAGVQLDCLYTENEGQDFTFNSIWDSKAKITADGWQVEMRIPFAALRFSQEKVQTWGINFFREVRRNRFNYTWNLIDNKIDNQSNQAGTLLGIENIQTPTRLFFIPYTSFYVNANSKTKTYGELKGGLDIKYGINDAFTLDAILIPDFGQTKFDNVILNLGPFEQQFNENRPFFTEGTDLFSKGDLVYSRRIGGSPTRQPNIAADEEIVKSPSNVGLLNALKVSGRTKAGLGIGVLNAVTDNTYADIINTTTGATRSEKIESFANYNVLVFDQRFRKNSSVSFINTNVTRNGDFKDANVSALLFDLNTVKNTYNLSGNYKYSIVNDLNTSNDTQGFSYNLYAAETSGKFRYGAGFNYISDNFNINDLGFNNQKHFHSINTNTSFRTLKSTELFNFFQVGMYNYTEFDNRTGRLQRYQTNINTNIIDKKNNGFGLGINTSPFKTFDFYEARSKNEERFFTRPERIGSWFYFSSNYNNKFALDINPYFTIFNEANRQSFGIDFGPRYRFNDKFSLNYNFGFATNKNDIGRIGSSGSDIIFARRNVSTVTNSVRGKYAVNDVMTFNLDIRNYWSYTLNNQIYTLQNDGGLTENLIFTENRNQNFNSWNLDLSYNWIFTPGSQISILYRNSSTNFERGAGFNEDFGPNLRNLLNNQTLNHNLSVSFRYFIDYNQVKHIF